MMREPKYRAWHIETKRMHYNFQYFIINDLIGQPLTATIYWWDGCLLSNCELLEYTGLKDKNGKEIYEGEILGYNGIDYYKNTYQVRYEVKFGEYDNGEEYKDEISGCGWWLKRYLLIRSNGEFDRNVQIYDYQGLNGLDNMEVIGNIWENPELLESN